MQSEVQKLISVYWQAGNFNIIPVYFEKAALEQEINIHSSSYIFFSFDICLAFVFGTCDSDKVLSLKLKFLYSVLFVYLPTHLGFVRGVCYYKSA